MPTKSLRRISARKVTYQVQEQLKELVLSGAYGPGERLPSERDLIEALGVSRTAIREGLRVLEGLGLVVIRHGSRVYVGERLPDTHKDGPPIPALRLRRKTTQDLIDVRLIVEPEISAMAAKRATTHDFERLRQDVEQLRTDIGIIKRPPTDLRFHLDLCKAAHNRLLLVMLQWVIEFYAKSGQLPHRRDIEDHERVYAAVRRRDPEAARAAMLAHLQWVKERPDNEGSQRPTRANKDRT